MLERSNLREGFPGTEDAVDTLLSGMYAALLGSDIPPEVEEEAEVSVCLGLDDDPYNLEGPAIYLYMAVPPDRAGNVPEDIEGWQRLEEPKDNDMFWQLLGCYPERQ